MPHSRHENTHTHTAPAGGDHRAPYCLSHFPPPAHVTVLCLVPGLIEISTVERGVVSLYGVRSELFVAMNSRGRLYGTVGVHCIPLIVRHCRLLGGGTKKIQHALRSAVTFRDGTPAPSPPPPHPPILCH